MFSRDRVRRPLETRLGKPYVDDDTDSQKRRIAAEPRKSIGKITVAELEDEVPETSLVQEINKGEAKVL